MGDGAAPLFTFGVIADIQYADMDDGYNYHGTRKRYYRNSLRLLSDAVRWWEEGEERERRPGFILQLGDIIDGFNRRHSASKRALQTVLDEFSNCSAEVHHVWGNHEFYNFSRDELFNSVLDSRDKGEGSMEEVYAYHFSPAPKFRFVVLDAYDLSIIGRDESSERYKQSMKIIREHNSNDELNEPSVSAFSMLEGRFVKFNGGFSQEQLDWLDRILVSADEKEEKVTIVCHLPVHPFSTDSICLAWNYDKILSILNSHKSVVCYMAGHDHDGGYCRDEYGVHHLTLEGVIETPSGSNAFGTVYVYEDKMVLKGKGRTSDRVLMYR
ncbi:manganese-dependent ADP-ribose/CDP-alcohol diphosphatase isoform X2 [Pygocentrus nattereri]|uniref:Manganese-dependent ADP-ribose/CDP-alcohol diphosphatase n=1 Tax=Pygocentrus nattereri TaxID=42514 RepID=A0A3B4D5X2_PYGNA|nr:manganese-dependent ADP-ribose/CDP-alcohol diphosphatase isoform X2 [Pygocentrus nattereri]